MKSDSSIVLDTSVIIDFLRKKNKSETLLYKLSKTQLSLYISIITHTELYAGKSVWERKNAKKELTTISSGLAIIPLDEEISENAGKIKAKYGVDLIDAIIASTAVSNKLELVTLNTRHFQKITGLRLYKV